MHTKNCHVNFPAMVTLLNKHMIKRRKYSFKNPHWYTEQYHVGINDEDQKKKHLGT